MIKKINTLDQAESELQTLGLKIKKCLELVKRKEGWSFDDLAYYLDVNIMTLRNSLCRFQFSDMFIVILKLKNAIPEKLAEDYRAALERVKVERRRAKRAI